MTDTLTPEIATIQSDPYIPQFQTIMQPTDKVLQAKGGREKFSLYDEIRKDPHAYAVLQKRKLEITSREWKVQPASESRLDKKAAAEVERQLKALNFDRLTGGLMGAVLKGFSVAEVIWENVNGTWTAVKVNVKKQRRFRFDMDGRLRVLTRLNSLEGEIAPDRKFIVHRFSIDDDNDDPYGVGIGAVLYWPAWFKRQTLAHWLRGTEKSATPTTHATYQGAEDDKKREELASKLRRISTDSVIVTSDSVSLELLESSRGGGGDLYEALNRYLDELMSEAVLGETLSTNGGENGSRSLGEVHNQVRVAIAKADSDLISETVRESLTKWIVELNFPGAGIPEVYREFEEPEDLDDKADRDTKIVQMGYRPADVNYINETYGGDWVEARPPTPPVDPNNPGGKSPTAGLDFADNPIVAQRNGDKVTADLSDQLDSIGAPSIDDMLDGIREACADATSYDDLLQRLAHLSANLGVDDFASIMGQAMTLAQLEGHASVSDANG